MLCKKTGFLPWVTALLALASSPALPAADTTAIAMVIDLQGKAVLVRDAHKAELSILSEINRDQRVQFDSNARAVLVYLQSGQEFEVKGPALVRFGMQAPQALSGNQPTKHGLALATSGKQIRINPVVVAQAAAVMRSMGPGLRLKLISPDGSKSLDAHPLFQWQPLQPGLKYQFELLDDTGKSLYSASVSETRLLLPAGISLQDGVVYTWLVSTPVPEGKGYSNAGDFTIASEALRAEVLQLQPAANAALSERVVFAAWLEQMKLRDEARKYWKLAAAERQDDQGLKVLAGE